MKSLLLPFLVLLGSLRAEQPELFKEGDLWGYTYQEQIIYDASFLEAKLFRKELAAVKTESGWGFINRKGEFIVQPLHDRVSDWFGDRAYFELNKKMGMVDGSSGEQVFAADYDAIKKFSANLLFLKKSSSWLASDLHGVFVSDKVFKNIFRLNKELYAVQSDTGWGLINLKPSLVLVPTMDEIYKPVNDLIRIRFQGKYGYLNESGITQLKPVYEMASDFRGDGSAMVVADGWLMQIDKTGKILRRHKQVSAPSAKSVVDGFYQTVEGGNSMQVLKSAPIQVVERIETRSVYPVPFYRRRAYPFRYGHPSYPGRYNGRWGSGYSHSRRHGYGYRAWCGIPLITIKF